MDHRQTSGVNAYKENLQKEFDKETLERDFVVENGATFRVPYRMIKKVEIAEVSKEEMIDMQHAARLQYRLMLLDTVIKATVDYSRSLITIIYNPKGADNLREKASLDELIAFLAKEGVRVDRSRVKEEDYDYYKNFYSKAFYPKRVREHAPYGWTIQEWQKLKPGWMAKQKKGEEDKLQKFHAWQDEYARKMGIASSAKT